MIGKGFGWLKQTGPLREVKLRGLEKVDWLFLFSYAAHNLIRLPRLIAQPQKTLRTQGPEQWLRASGIVSEVTKPL